MIQRVLEMALTVSEEHEQRPIRGITMEIGQLRHMVPSALEFAFEAATQGTRAEGAAFEWKLIPLEVLCQVCETRYEPENEFWLCPQCGSPRGVPTRGDELNLVEVELADSATGEAP
jgi:hydrogenase nickel incorporation protein HypA/HybF